MCYGSDFVARSTVRLFAKLQIEAIRSVAFSPWQKGVVERAIRTFQSDCATMLPGFIGHSVAHRKKIEGRKAFSQRLGRAEDETFNVSLSGEALQQIVDRWADEIYAQREHGGIGRMSPFARAASSRQPIRAVDADALATLLMPAPDAEGIRTVTKNGVRVGGFHYLTPDCLPGERVFVRLDPADAGTIWLFDPQDDRLIGKALNGHRAGINPGQLAAETRAAQNKLIDEQIADVRKQTRRRVTERTVLDNRLAAASQAGNLVAFPPRSEIHTTPALDAGAEVAAMRRGDTSKGRPLSPVEARILAELEAAPAPAAPTNVRRLRQQETPQQLYRKWLALDERLRASEPVTPEEAAFYGSYANHPAKKSLDPLYQEYGEAALR